MSFEEVLVEIRSIIDSGTRLNIDYQLRETMDEESIQELYDYFLGMHNDDLAQAIRDMGMSIRRMKSGLCTSNS